MISVGVLVCIMKNISCQYLPSSWFIKTAFSFLLLATLAQSKVNAQSLYEDNFTTNPGSLNGRTTAAGFGNWVASDSELQTGGGLLTVGSNSPVNWHSATFALPTLTSSDTLSLILTVRPSGQNFMGIGFTPNAGQYVANSGYGWLYYQGLGAPYPNIQIFTGSANGGSVGKVYFAGLENPNVNFDASLPTTFRYTYSASAKTLSITAENGTRSSTLLNNLDVSSVPLSGFSNFALQFEGQNVSADSAPSYVSNIRLETVPEPSVNLLMGLGALTLGIVRVRRARPAQT